jgi:cyclophilin family peptidyl-prolyl cis-trans isomerase
MRARANGHTATAYSAWPEHAILDDSGVVALIARRAGRELRPQACTVHAARAAHSALVGSGATAVRSAPVVCSGSVSMANSGPHTNRKPVRPPSPLSASLSLFPPGCWLECTRFCGQGSANAIESESNARAAVQCADRSSLPSPHSVHSQFFIFTGKARTPPEFLDNQCVTSDPLFCGVAQQLMC